MPDMFTYKSGNKEFALAGIWIETTESENSIKTNEKVTDLNSGENNTSYGFIANTKANAMTEDEKTEIQKYNQKINIESLNITTQNYTIIKIIDTNKIVEIKGSGICDSNTGIVTITYYSSNILRIIDEEGTDLTMETTTLKAISVPQSNGIRNFYAIENNGNISIIPVEVTGNQIVANAEFDTTTYTMTITVTENRFDIVSIYFITKHTTLSENSKTGVTGMLGNGTYEFKITDSKGYEEIISKEVTGVSIFVIADENDLQIFKAAVATYDGTNSSTLAIQVADIVTTGEWEPIKNGWRRI